MRLSDFIRQYKQDIIREWESFATTLAPATHLSRLQLRDHIEQILAFIAKDLTAPQTDSEQVKKSHGERDNLDVKNTAAEAHGSLRYEEGFNIIQMVSEYRALRTSIVKLWTKSKSVLSDVDVIDLTRFNECIDQALAESITKFMQMVDYSRDLLLGILGHDIRSPLATINMSAHLMPKVGTLNEKQTLLASQIEGSTTRAIDIVGDLLDLVRARVGASLPVVKKPLDIGIAAKQIVDELSARYPDRTILLTCAGDVTGEWDVTRLGQVFSNLINNAVQYGDKNSPIDVVITGDQQYVVLAFHNKGEPIPSSRLASIFNSFTRGEQNPDQASASNLGLGLFITRQIVISHGGVIDVESDEIKGTTFTIRLPKSMQPLAMKSENLISASRY